jgi:glycerol-3-phosphate acyltransferase PlsY
VATPDLTDLHPVAVVALAFVAGAVPFSNLMARRVRRVDLREVDQGTVSGTALFKVAGFGPLALAGSLDVAKGALGPALAGDRPLLAAVAGAAAVSGHNWSPFLGGAGGRGISPAMGALAPHHWPGSLILLAGPAIGKVAGDNTGAGAFLADVLLVPLLGVLRGGEAARAAALVLVPMFAKRLTGNRPPPRRDLRAYARRLVFDNDGPAP